MVSHPREEHEFENKIVRRIFGPKREEDTGVGENCTVRNLIVFTLRQVL
jgi:hypothetical protein